MHHATNEKKEKTHDGRNRTTKIRKIQNEQRKGNLRILRDIGHHQISADERKNF